MRIDDVILVADGFEPLRRLFRDALERAGFSVLHAGTAAEAENVYTSSARIALLICDVSIPGGGRALATELRARRPDLPLLFLSIYDGIGELYFTGALEGAGFLRKPFTIAQLTDSIEGLLGTRRAASAGNGP